MYVSLVACLLYFVMDKYSTPISTQQFELEIKRSRFVTTVGHVEGKAAGKIFIQGVRNEYQDASHHCWAMVAGIPDDIYQIDQSDDGEPKGTAGKPMLNVLQHADLGNVVVVVTRYFGGIKLGAGGLVRAYTHSVSLALSKLQTRHNFLRNAVCITLPYALLDSLEHWLQSTNIEISDRVFTDDIQVTLMVPPSDQNSLEFRLKELGGGTIAIRKSHKDVRRS